MRLSIKYCEEFLFVHPLVVLLYYWLAEKLPLFCWPRMCKIKVKKNFKYNFEKKMKLQDYNAQELLKGRRFIWIKCLQHRVFLYPSSFPTTLSPTPSGSSSVQFIGGINHARLLVWVFFWFPFYNAKITSALKDDIKNGNVFSIHSSCQSCVPHLFLVNTQIYNLFWTEHYEARHKSVSYALTTYRDRHGRKRFTS